MQTCTLRNEWKSVSVSGRGGMSGMSVIGEGKEGGMASKSILLNAVENWLDGTPMDCRVRAIQIRAVGGARALPR